MKRAKEGGKKENIPESESRSKPRVDVRHKTNAEIQLLMAGCGVPLRFTNAMREDLDPELWEQVQPFMTRESLFLSGPPGVGKTHLAAALIREKISKDNEKYFYFYDERLAASFPTTSVYLPTYPRMISVPDLLLEIRECFKGLTGEPESAVIYKYAAKECLILDDLGVEKTTEWSLQTLYTIIDRRYREEKQTLITSNLTLNEIAEKVGDRIASRIAGMCKVVEIKGRDRRLKN